MLGRTGEAGAPLALVSNLYFKGLSKGFIAESSGCLSLSSQKP